jgi:hypothetical protein
VQQGVSCRLTLVTLEQVRFEIDWTVQNGLKIVSAKEKNGE